MTAIGELNDASSLLMENGVQFDAAQKEAAEAHFHVPSKAQPI